MLKSELIRARLAVRDGQARTRPLPTDYRYLTMANELIALFQRHVGHSRGALAEALRDYEGDSLDYPVIRGLAAVLEARCTFASALLGTGASAPEQSQGSEGPVSGETEEPVPSEACPEPLVLRHCTVRSSTVPKDGGQSRRAEGLSTAVTPADLRAALFCRGPVTRRPGLFSQTTREQALAEASAQFALAVEQVEVALFADLAEEQILLDPGEPPAPGDLIARYNLELARGLLYWAREVRLRVRDGYKDLFKYIKLFKLMYTIRPLDGDSSGGYHITLHGPISPFVKSTIRYGLQFAKFLPALLLCRRWQMEADVQPPRVRSRGPLRYTLNDQTDLRTHFKASGPFDSQLEADFAAEFEAKYGGARRKWELAREDELILVGGTVMIPDFSFTHRRDGRRALLEIVGFWHPNYLRRKLAKVRQAGRRDLILLVYKSANVAEGEFEAASAGEVLTFVRKPILKEVLAAVERCAVLPEEKRNQAQE
jgi:predicted nuclease of restriction endonuclease-like RecB superfamily